MYYELHKHLGDIHYYKKRLIVDVIHDVVVWRRLFPNREIDSILNNLENTDLTMKVEVYENKIVFMIFIKNKHVTDVAYIDELDGLCLADDSVIRDLLPLRLLSEA